MKKAAFFLLALMLVLSLAACSNSDQHEDALVGLSTYGAVEADGPKLSAIIIEYDVAVDGDSVALEDYEVWNMMQDQAENCLLGENPGEPIAVYVNDTAEPDLNGGTDSGHYVVIEVNTDYLLSTSLSYKEAMAASVKQIGDISASDGTQVTAVSEEIVNFDTNSYTETRNSGETVEVVENNAIDGTYYIEDVDRFTIGVFEAENCFDEATGEYEDVNLDYALFVPEDYDSGKEYKLVFFFEDAMYLGDDAVLAITGSKTPTTMVSDEMQQYVKDQGYGGIIVLCPQITTELRSARDNYTVSAAIQASWQLLDWVTEEYNVDENSIYAAGQSMGAMSILAMAAQRDNYFAAIMPIGCAWGQNYDKDLEYEGSTYYATPVDGTYVWSQNPVTGEEYDYQNMYYVLSDDNLLFMNSVGDGNSVNISPGTWTEFYYLYLDLAGIEIPTAHWDPLALSVEEQKANTEALFAEENETGIYFGMLDLSGHGASWITATRIDTIYTWLLSQTRESENERGKIECLLNEFEEADEQILTEDRLVAEVTDDDGDEVSYYYKTGKAGAGTAGYNTGWYVARGGPPVRKAGWTVNDID